MHPWRSAHVSNGARNGRPCEDHELYFEGLRPYWQEKLPTGRHWSFVPNGSQHG